MPVVGAFPVLLVAGVDVLLTGLVVDVQSGRVKSRARVVVAAVLGVVVVVVVGVAALTLMRDDGSVYGCADVGLEGPRGTTAEEALAAFVERKGGDGADWEAVGDDDFKPRHARALLGFEGLSVHEVQPGTWQVVGGCVSR